MGQFPVRPIQGMIVSVSACRASTVPSSWLGLHPPSVFVSFPRPPGWFLPCPWCLSFSPASAPRVIPCRLWLQVAPGRHGANDPSLPLVGGFGWDVWWNGPSFQGRWRKKDPFPFLFGMRSKTDGKVRGWNRKKRNDGCHRTRKTAEGKRTHALGKDSARDDGRGVANDPISSRWTTNKRKMAPSSVVGTVETKKGAAGIEAWFDRRVREQRHPRAHSAGADVGARTCNGSGGVDGNRDRRIHAWGRAPNSVASHTTHLRRKRTQALREWRQYWLNVKLYRSTIEG